MENNNERKMTAVLLNGSLNSDPGAVRAAGLLRQELSQRGYSLQEFYLPETPIKDCMGDFFCWIRYPGTCAIQDANRDVARAVAGADVLVLLTPLSFGGYSSHLKKALDHLPQNILPFFTSINGEIHHQKRYEHYASLLVVALADESSPAVEAIFHYLGWRNAINFHAPAYASGVLYRSQDEQEMHRSLQSWLAALDRPAAHPPVKPPLPTPAAIAGDRTSPRRALLVIGSPRGPKSTSSSLGSYLLSRLQAAGMETAAIDLYPALRRSDRLEALLTAVDETDLLILAYPLYIDNLPAPDLRFLELLNEHRRDHPADHAQALAVISNCGFPEADHIDTSLAICAQFAGQAGFTWAGGLPLGGGEGIVHGVPLENGGGQTQSIRQALDLAAPALIAGEPVPDEAIRILRQPRIPAWLYRIFGDLGWRMEARKYGVLRKMRARPYVSE